MVEKRAELLLHWMSLIERYTLNRALEGLTYEEFVWEPHPGAWGVRRRAECTTPNAAGADGSEWVLDSDWSVDDAAEKYRQQLARGNRDRPARRGEADAAVMPMTTVGWLLSHFGAATGVAAQLEFVGGSTVPTRAVYRQMWVPMTIPTVAEAVGRFWDGWGALQRVLTGASDEMLGREYEDFPRHRGDLALAAMLNEISHHGTQICMLRDFYANQ